MRVSGRSQTHSSMGTASTPASSGERPGGSAALHPRPLSKQACMRNSCIRGKQTDTSQCLHTHLLPHSRSRALKNALMQITYIKTRVPLRGELFSSTARSCTLKRLSSQHIDAHPISRPALQRGMSVVSAKRGAARESSMRRV